MTSFRSQLQLLLWKNWILRKRHKTRVFMEFLWPLILFLILMWVRTRGLKQHRPNCHLIEKTLPSVGGFEFFQNFFCTLNNTCHSDYVENEGNKVWENSLFMGFIRDSTPLIDEIVSSSKGIKTVSKLWEDLISYIQLISAFRTKDETNKIGEVKLKELMSKYGRKAFVEVVPTYTVLSSDQAYLMLESVLYLDKVNRTNIDELLEAFKIGDCHPQKEFELISFPSEDLVRDICDLDRQQSYLLILFITNYLDKGGLVNKLQGNIELENFLEETKKSNWLLDYDLNTLGVLVKLGGLFKNFGTVFRRFANLTGGEMASALVYEGLCGVEFKGNRSSFGFDPGAATRFDSLRDRLKEWNPDHHYEMDPEISSTCNTMFQRLESMPFTALLWRQVKPFIRGVIYYAPVTPFTQSVMEKVDEKFFELQKLEIGMNSIINIVHRTRKWFRNHTEELSQTLSILSDKKNIDVVLKFLELRLSPSEKTQIYRVLERFGTMDLGKTLERMDFVSELLSEVMSCVKYNKTEGFPTEWQAVNAGSKLLSAEKLWAVVVFEDLNGEDGNITVPHHLKYKIRMDSDKVDGTRAARDRLTSKTPRRRPAFDLKYITNGFVYLQEMIERSIIELITGKQMDGISTYLQQFPYPCHIYDQFIRAISRTFPLFMVLSWVYASSMIVKSIVMEKELRLREVMKVMGLGNGVIWCGWFIDSFVVMSFSSTILTLVLKYGKVIENSDVTLIWVFMISYTVATINFSFFVSTFFTRANSAAAAGGILFFVSYLPYNMLLIWEEQLSWYHTLCSCLISNVAFGFGCTYFARYEEDGVGAQWGRITLNTLPGDDFNLSFCILMLWVDSLLYWVLTWYIEAVFPGEAGVPKPWNFFIKKSYWKGRSLPRSPTKVLYESVPDIQGSDESQVEFETPPVIEAEPEGLTCGVKVTNLSKTYSNGKVALRDLSINFYENQITSFLGHNGAGKTTTISILTGLFPPTSGSARIYGLDIQRDMDSIHTNTGICPQYNTLFDRLNVEEHMQFYAGLKGKCDETFEEEFTQMISDLGIPHKRYEFPSNLSGGMKRKLSVACSFIGGSKTVFLDEPTSGVDPYSRRSIWELLLKYKQGRTIILTTHFMDEADLLGDRIAIISQGKLKACGSSLFLKSQFGQGYSLRLVRDDPLILKNGFVKPENDEIASEQLKAFRLNPSLKQTELTKAFVRNNVRDAILMDDIGSEVVFLLPYGSIQNFPELFQRLDTHLADLGVSSYGISDTTLEDVFLKITIEDIEANVDSFDSLSSSCKRRAMEMLKKLKGQVGRKKDMQINSVTPKIVTSPTDGCLLEIPNGISTVSAASANNLLTSGNLKLDIDGNLIPQCDSVSTGGETTNLSLLEEGCPEDDFPARGDEFKRSLFCLALIQICMIYLKRLWNSLRNKKAMFFEIILPAVFIAITLAFTLILPPASDEPARELSPWTYPSPNKIFFSENKTRSVHVPEFSSFVQGLIGPVGMGTACVQNNLDRKLCNPERWSNQSMTKFQSSRHEYPGAQFESCSCSLGSLHCPGSIDKVNPPAFRTPTNDYVQDVTKLNIPEWIEKTYRKYETSRYGGFELQLRDQPAANITEFIQLLDRVTKLLPLPNVNKSDFENDDDDFFKDEIEEVNPTSPVFKVWYENRGWVSSVAYLNALHNIILRENLPENLIDQKNEFGITVYNHPMNLTKSQSNKESIKTAGLGVIHAVCVIFALSFVPASFTVYLIEERKSGGKHLHLVSGVKPITYWVANFLYDMTKYCVPAILTLILFLIFGAKAYIGPPSIASFITLLLLYGWASIPAMYPFSFWFSVPSTAFVVLACMNLFIGVMSTVSTFVLEQFGDPELERIGAILKQVFLIFPHYCLGRGLMELVRLDMETIAFDRLAIQMKPKDRFDWENLGKMLFFLALHGAVFFTFNLCFEYRQVCYFLFKRKRPAFIKNEDEEDEDVIKERNRVLGDLSMDSTLRAENLTKFYPGKKHPAVNGLTFAIARGECFGLLGVNGAGKSSSFKMLTGDVRITTGRAKICGSDVETDLDSARKHFGYCPQEDGLDPLLDAFEMLQLYGRLRGMTPQETDVAVQKLIQTLGLARCAKRRCGTYSGGNRRKLSTAIALIGDPDVVFLDEPTSGMDPASRRKFWKVILRLVRLGKSVVLTSHSMEECEALCSRIAIMVNGKFMCLGSLQHLKNRFGDGYTVTVRCVKSNQDEFLSRVERDLPSARLEDCHCSQLKFTIPQFDARLGDIFNVMYAMKKESLIEDYSVSQTTLDDIFVKFASDQKDDMDR